MGGKWSVMTDTPRQDVKWACVAGRLEGGGHVLPVRVYYEDTDAGGVVYHANYLRFCERGRSDFLRLLDVRHGALRGADGRRLLFVVRRMTCEFLAPARLDDVLEVRTWAGKCSRVRLHLRQEIRLVERGGTDAPRPPQTGPIFTAEVMVAVIDDSGRPARLPDEVMNKLAALPAARD